MEKSISVIIPTHFRNEQLNVAIQSVLNQDYPDIELIVVDDSGERYAEPVLDLYDEVIPIYRSENGGWAAAYTSGIEASSGEYIQFLDDDDYLLQGKLSKTAAVLDNHAHVGVSYCGVIRGDEGEFLPKPKVAGDILEYALQFKTFPVWTGSMLMERDILIDCMPLAGMAKGDDLDIELGDTNLKIELARRTLFDYVDECLVYYHREGNKLWTGPRKFHKVMQNVRYQQELYDQYPTIKRELLATWYQRQGLYWLEERTWSAKAIICFLKSTYHSQGTPNKLKGGVGAVISMFGHHGWLAAERVRNMVNS